MFKRGSLDPVHSTGWVFKTELMNEWMELWSHAAPASSLVSYMTLDRAPPFPQFFNFLLCKTGLLHKDIYLVLTDEEMEAWMIE